MIESRKALIWVLGLVFMAFAGSLWQSAYAQKQHRKDKQRQEETYTRPKPSEPAKPEIPGANRYQEDKVFLEHAEELYRPDNVLDEVQIVKGDVRFRHGSYWMFCDSAFYYPARNSLDAFGHVELRQGDTLHVYSDRLYYDGFEKHATLVRGATRDKVKLQDPKVTLTTDSLDYDLNTDRGWYTTGGRLEDDVNTLTSVYGEYSPASKQAVFTDDVLLVNRKDGYRLITENLNYNTGTHIADIDRATRIEGANDTIITTRGTYNTLTDHAELTARSTIFHRDSSMNVTTLEGDSIIYDKGTRTSRAYMFRDLSKTRRPMVINDTARKVTLIGGYGEYNDSTRTAMSTEYPLLIEYSRPDSLFLRADTILSFVVTGQVWPDSLRLTIPKEIRERLRSYATLGELGRDLPGGLRLIPAGFPLPGYGAAEAAPQNQTAAAEAAAQHQTDSAAAPARIPAPRTDRFGRDSAYMIPKDFHVARAISHARFFNKDIQGIADTLIFHEMDSILYMLRKPAVWSGERQVYGNRIDVHFNDSTPDWAHLPEGGVVAEHLDEDFYNQLSGTDLKAFFHGNDVRRIEVSGNVQAIFLPQEKDSSYNKLVNAESSYLTADLADRKMEKLKMWPEVTGTVTPLFDVKKSQQFLQGFRWLEALRPKRRWYGDRVTWEDELGDVPDELVRYFDEPPLVRQVPVSPTGNMPQRTPARPGMSGPNMRSGR